MVSPAVQLASKIPDRNLQVWAVTLLAGKERVNREGWGGGGSRRDELGDVCRWLWCDEDGGGLVRYVRVVEERQ